MIVGKIYRSGKESAAYIRRTGETSNRALWPSGKAADLKFAPVGQRQTRNLLGPLGVGSTPTGAGLFCLLVVFFQVSHCVPKLLER